MYYPPTYQRMDKALRKQRFAPKQQDQGSLGISRQGFHFVLWFCVRQQQALAASSPQQPAARRHQVAADGRGRQGAAGARRGPGALPQPNPGRGENQSLSLSVPSESQCRLCLCRASGGQGSGRLNEALEAAPGRFWGCWISAFRTKMTSTWPSSVPGFQGADLSDVFFFPQRKKKKSNFFPLNIEDSEWKKKIHKIW